MLTLEEIKAINERIKTIINKDITTTSTTVVPS
jgi:hypothetical protein